MSETKSKGCGSPGEPISGPSLNQHVRSRLQEKRPGVGGRPTPTPITLFQAHNMPIFQAETPAGQARKNNTGLHIM